MVCAVGRVLIMIPQAGSLKEKRRVVKSITVRLSDKFSVSCIEADFNDKWQKALIGISYVAKDIKQADKIENSVRNFFDENFEINILDMDFEKLNY